jgi:hypothetical protein
VKIGWDVSLFAQLAVQATFAAKFLRQLHDPNMLNHQNDFQLAVSSARTPFSSVAKRS